MLKCFLRRRTPRIYFHYRLLTNNAKNGNEAATEDVIQAPTSIKQQIQLDYPRRHNIIQTLQHYLHCSDEKTNEIYTKQLALRHLTLTELSNKMKHLFNCGLSREIVLEYPWLLTMEQTIFEPRFLQLQAMNPRNINDFVPLLQYRKRRLERIERTLKRDGEVNRIYYISDRLGIEPHVVCQYLSKYTFVFEKSPYFYKTNINLLLKYGVEPRAVLNDLWAIQYFPSVVEARMKEAKAAKRKPMMPWMVRCSPETFKRSLEISTGRQEFLDGLSVEEYLSKRLGFELELIRDTINRTPAVGRIRASKLRRMLDYLLDEEGFEPILIFQSIRVFMFGEETIKQRIEQLRQINCRPTSLSIVCKSHGQFSRFVAKWTERTRYFSKKNEIEE